MEKIKEIKPRFYLQDLDNYTDDFLREIILWQDEYIRELKKSSHRLKGSE